MRGFRNLLIVAVASIVSPIAAASSMPDLGPKFAEACARFEREVGPLDPGAYAPPEVAPEKNAAIPIVEAMGLLDFTEKDVALSDALKSPTTSWTPEQRAALRALLTRNDHALSRAQSAVARPEARFDIDHARPITAKLPKITDLLHLSVLIVLDGRLALDEGDSKRAVGGVEVLGGIARALDAEPAFELGIMARGFERREMLLMRDVLRSTSIDVRALRDLPRTVRNDEPIKRAETQLTYHAVGLIALMAQDADEEKDGDEAAAAAGTFAGYLDQLRAVVLGLRRGLPPSRSMGPPPPDDPLLAARSTQDQKILRDLLTASLSDDVWNQAQVTLAARRLARAAIAVRLDGLEIGRYPQRLDGVAGDRNGLAYKVAKGGSVVISAPVAQELNDAVPLGAALLREDGLTWVLPPLAPSGRR